AAGGVRLPARAGRGRAGGVATRPGAVAGPAGRTAAAWLAGTPRRQCRRDPDPRHPGRRGLSARHPACAAFAVAGLGTGRLAARRGRQPPSRRQRPDPWPDVHDRGARPAPPGPRLDCRRHDRRAVLWRHADDRAAARAGDFLAVAPRRRPGRRGRRTAVVAGRSAAAAPALRLGGRGGSRDPGRTRCRRARTGRPARGAGAVAAPAAARPRRGPALHPAPAARPAGGIANRRSLLVHGARIMAAAPVSAGPLMHRTAQARRRPVLVLVLLATALAGCSARPTPPAPGLAADGVPSSDE